MPDLQSMVQALRADFEKWQNPAVERRNFGTDDPVRIAQLVETFVQERLFAAVSGCLFYGSSVGCSFGLELEDGRRVVLKVRAPAAANPHLALGPRALEQVSAVMRWLRAQNYPCPDVLLGPTPLGRGLATVEGYLDDGQLCDGFVATSRRALALGLRDLSELLRSYSGPQDSLLHFVLPRDQLFPEPHSPVFVFDQRAPSAEWIDAYARQARARLLPNEPALLVHADWRAEHVRFDGDRVSAVYDWDSLSRQGETAMVGVAAHAFGCNWARDDGRRVPTLNDVCAFVDDYAAQRAEPFSKRERQAVFASALYSIAYGARCVHSSAPETRDWIGDNWAALLQQSGGALLALAGGSNGGA